MAHPSDQALAVPATPANAVDGPTGFDPSRERPLCLGMGSIMLAGEEACGRKAIWPHHKRLPKWFDPFDWSVWPVISYDANEVHIVAISSARKGALARLIARAGEAGLSPVIVEPMGPAMGHILSKGRWRRAVIGDGWESREEWRPAIAIEAAAAGETGTGSTRRAKARAESIAQKEGQ